MSTSAAVAIGSVVALWRYPVKSMMGEEVNAVDLLQGGVVGDRAYALMDTSAGKVVSAKNPRRWPRMFDFRASLVEPPRPGKEIPPVRITLPDGTLVQSGQGDLEDVLSRALGRPVRLETVAPEKPRLEEYWPDMDDLDHRDAVTDEEILSRTFLDGAAVHLLTTATIDQLRASYPEGRFEARRFRPNVVVRPAGGQKGFVENSWIGRTVALGDEVRLAIQRGCPRCVMTTLPQGDLPGDPGILRAAVQQNQAKVGVYAGVLQGGRVHRGDPVRIVG